MITVCMTSKIAYELHPNLAISFPIRTVKICGLIVKMETVIVSLQLHNLIPLDTGASMNTLGIAQLVFKCIVSYFNIPLHTFLLFNSSRIEQWLNQIWGFFSIYAFTVIKEELFLIDTLFLLSI